MTATLDAQRAAQLAWRCSPTGYAAKLGGLPPPPHLQLLGRYLTMSAAGQCDRLMVLMPPRHAKSTTCSEWGPTWALDLFPAWRVLLGSYEATFASEWGWKVRQHIARNPARLRVRLAPDFKARNAWYTTAGGGMFTAGIGGAFTGRGGDILLIDDPFKNWMEAHSKTTRDAVWNWYLSTAYTRGEPMGRIVLVMTRWHEDDLAGRLLDAQAKGGDQWTVLRLPALSEGVDDPLGRPEGAALWPERFPVERLQKIKAVLGSYLFGAMYQQRPAPEEGSILKRSWWKWYHRMPQPHEWDELVASWDMAFKDEASSSYVVGQVWGRIGADKYLIDQVRDHMDFPTTVRAVLSLAAKHPDARAKLVEDKANGPAVIQVLQRKVSGLLAKTPKGSKESRAHACTGDLEAGNVWLPDPELAPWVHDFVEECAVFPNGAHDDQVDAFTQAMERLGTGTDTLDMTWVDDRLAGRR